MADIQARAIGSLIGLLSATIRQGQAGWRPSLTGLNDPSLTPAIIAPIAIRWHGWPRIAQEQASLQAKALGADNEGVETSEIFVRIVTRALLGYSRDRILEPFDWPGERAVALLAQGSWRNRAPPLAIQTAANTLATTLWIVAGAGHFDGAMQQALALDREGATVVAVSQLAGAIWPPQLATSSKVVAGLQRPAEGIARTLLAAPQR